MDLNNAKVFLAPNGLCIDEDSIWFTQCQSNKLVQINRKDYSIENVILLGEDCEFDYNRCNGDIIYIINGNVYIFLHSKKYICVYNIEKKELYKKEKGWNKYPVYANSILPYRDDFYLLPCWGNPLLKYQTLSEEMLVISSKDDSDQYMSSGCDYYGEQEIVYACDRRKNSIYFINLKKGYVEEKKVGNSSNLYFGIKKIGSYFILPNLDKRCITIWNEKNGEIEEIKSFPQLYDSNISRAYKKMVNYNNKIYLFPDEGNMILKFDVNTKEVDRGFENIEINTHFLDYYIDDKTAVTYDGINNQWLELDMELETVERFEQKNNSQFGSLLNEECEYKHDIVYETFFDNLNNLINYVCTE